MGVIPWSPLARGLLTRDLDAHTTRADTDLSTKNNIAHISAADRKIIEAVAAIAAARGLPRAQIALAWLLSKPGVTAPIVGVTKPDHLTDAVAALEVTLSAEEIAQLEAHYVPHEVSGMAVSQGGWRKANVTVKGVSGAP